MGPIYPLEGLVFTRKSYKSDPSTKRDGRLRVLLTKVNPAFYYGPPRPTEVTAGTCRSILRVLLLLGSMDTAPRGSRRLEVSNVYRGLQMASERPR